MKSLLSVSFLLIILSASGNGQPLGHEVIDGFDGYKWGTSLETMKRSFGLTVVYVDTVFSREIQVWKKKGSVCGLGVTMLFTFTRKEFHSVEFRTSTLSDFSTIVQAVEELIGPCDEYRIVNVTPGLSGKEKDVHIWYLRGDNTVARATYYQLGKEPYAIRFSRSWSGVR